MNVLKAVWQFCSFLIILHGSRIMKSNTNRFFDTNMVIDKKILDELSSQAKTTPRLRMALDLRNSPDDLSQRLLNALEPGTVMPIHRHLETTETVVLLRGKVEWLFYDDSGNETERVLLDANGEQRMINVEQDRWHSLVCLQSGSILFETKDGPYHPLTEKEILTIEK